MTQIDTIRRIIQGIGSGELFSISDIRSDTKFPRASIRRVLSRLSRQGEITRVKRGLFKAEQFRRKFIGTTKYKGNPRQFFALTYEANDEDREIELLEALNQFLNEEYVDAAGNTGYADDFVDATEVDEGFIFPNIQVGDL